MSGGKVIAFSIFLLISFVIQITMFFNSHIFIREFILFWIFFVAAIVFLVGLNKKWGAPGFTVFFSVQILNFIYLNSNTVKSYSFLFAIALFVSALGLLISIASISSAKSSLKPKVVDMPAEKKTVKKAAAKTASKKKKTTRKKKKEITS